VIITFYSYKGGVGRSMALMNVAEILADVGYDVIVCDFDLEAPGLERYTTDDLDIMNRLRASRGVIDLLEEYRETLAGAGPVQPGKAEPISAPEGFCDINGLFVRRPSSCAVPVSSPNAKRLGQIRFLGAGRRDGNWAIRYSEHVQQFNWSDFYQRWAGAAYVDFFREDLTEDQTIVLVDSRTGVAEYAGICTHHLADLVVLLSAPNDLNIEGTKWMASTIAAADLDGLRGGRPLQVMPVAARVETASQVEELAAFRERFEREFAASVPAAAGAARDFIQKTEIPYIPYFAFTEKVVARQNVSPHRELYGAYEALAQAVVNVGLVAGILIEPQRQDWLTPLGTTSGTTTALARERQAGMARTDETVGRALRLAPRPVFLAGREGLLAELDARLGGDDGVGPRVVALTGLGGAGKTSVALEYAYRHLAEVGVAWQFSVEDPGVLAAGFGELAAQLGAAQGGDPVAAVHRVLAVGTAPWLLVFDNAPDRASVASFVPPAGPGWVLITSRNQIWPPGQALEVPVLDTEVAAEFLADRTGDADRRAALDLAGELGGLPLALEQAAAYMQASGESLAGYLASFLLRRAAMLDRGEPIGYPETVATTWRLAFEDLQEVAPGAAGLLRLLAFCAPEAIPLRLLLQPRPHLADRLGPEVVPLLGPLLEDPLVAGDAIAMLRRYSLVTAPVDGSVSVHRLVQAVTAEQMPAELASQWQRAAAALIEAAVPADPEDPAAWSACAALLPHAQGALDLTSDGMWKIAQYIGNSGSYTAARDLFQLIADAPVEDAYGAEHPDTLAARANLAYWTGEAGDAAAARDQFAALLPVYERMSGPEHPAFLDVRANLARWTGAAGNAAAARDQFAALLPVRERVSGPEHPAFLDVRANLARWTGAAGDTAGARDQFAALLPVRERVSGPEHPATLTDGANFARWTGQAGDAAGARDQYAALLPIFERVLGPEHPETLAARGNLAQATGAAGDAAGARDQYAALLPVRERVSGPEHPDTLTDGANFARWTGQAGDAAGARDQYAALLPIFEQVLGPEHPDTLTVRGSLATWTGRAGDAAGARDQYAALLPVRERTSGPEHPHTLTVRGNLARRTGEAGDAAGARDQFAALLPLFERVLGPEHPDTLITRASLAWWTGEAGDAAGARDQYAALLPVRERASGPEHPHTLTTRASLARWTGEAGDAAGARDQFAALLPVCERVLGPKHPDTLATRASLAFWADSGVSRLPAYAPSSGRQQ
jgi:hypothetical protein